MGTGQRFRQFLDNLSLTEDQKANGRSRREAVIRVLNRKYHNLESGTANSLFVGSWAKLTRIRPPRDVDVLFKLPYSVYARFEQRTGNKQSQLLQEVKIALSNAYPNTAIRGDGPVIIVPFSTYNVEVIPAFELQGGGHWVCMTNSNGHYKKADYAAEADAIAASNGSTSGNTRDLVRMMKRWQGYCSVPIKSYHIELLAVEFLSNWEHRGKSTTYYDWMVRDFLKFLTYKANSYVYAPGTYEAVHLGDGWKSRAETAFARAEKACASEGLNDRAKSGDEWQKIFGPDIPRHV